jgi:hypothetical protein
VAYRTRGAQPPSSNLSEAPLSEAPLSDE